MPHYSRRYNRRPKPVRYTAGATRNARGLMIPRPPPLARDQLMKTTIVSSQNVNVSGANADLKVKFLLPMATANFPDYNLYAGLYDMMRVRGGRLWYQFLQPTAGTGVETPCCAGITMDTNSSASLINIQNQLSLSYHGPLISLFPSAATRHDQDFRCLSFLLRPEVAINANDAVGSSWIPTVSGSVPQICAATFFAEATGGSGVTSVIFFIEFDVEFKMRA